MNIMSNKRKGMMQIRIPSTAWLTLLLALIWVGCDTVSQDEFKELSAGSGGGGKPSGERKRIVLVEDFTGHQCGNCPRASEAVEVITDTYQDQVAVVAIHCGFFARTDNKYRTDYTTTVGNSIDSYFGASAAGLPQGMVNRKEIAGSRLLSHTRWINEVAADLAQDPQVYLNISNTFDPTTRELSCQVSMEYLQDLPEGYQLSVFLTESGIVSIQKDYQATPQDIENYTHKHVFRASLNGVWGDPVAAGAAGSADFTKSYSLTLSQDWQAENCEIVAFVHHEKDHFVLQAQKAALDETTGGNDPVDPVDPTGKKQVVLLEQITGHQCAKCPEATSIAAQLSGQYPGQVVRMAIHTGFFANTNNRYETDYTSEVGDELAAFFEATALGLPAGMISRQTSDMRRAMLPSEWSDAVANLVQQDPVIHIGIDNSYEPVSGELSSAVSVEYLQNLEDGHKISLFFTESGLISPQKDENVPGTVDQAYVHNDVLRTSINGIWGDDLPGGAPGSQNNVSNYRLNLDPAWRPENCAVIAVVYDTTTYQVVQAQKAGIPLN